MAKSKLFISFLVVVLLLVIHSCKPDRTVKSSANPNDPDSLYKGTKYTIQIPFNFPGIKSTYKDSLTTEGILLGRRLFYDKHLSVNGDKACASCHKLQFSMADSVPLSMSEFGLNKRSAPMLQNLAWAPALFWDGRQPTLADQAQDAFHNELGLNVTNAITYLKADTVYARLFKKAFGRPGNITERGIYLGIQEFLMTAISANSRFDSVQRGQAMFTTEEADAFYTVFISEKGECFHCHAFGESLLLVNYAEGATFRNNGLQVAATINDFPDPGRGGVTGVITDYGLFKNPTLRNIAVSAPYMHDGRYKTLQQVINFYSDSLNLTPNADQFIASRMDTLNGQHLLTGGFHLSDQQKAELLILLNDFTDTSFLNNPNLKSPF